MKTNKNESSADRRGSASRTKRTLLLTTITVCALVLSSVPVALAQVYGVARKTTVVSGPNRTVVATKTTVVAGGGGLPHGYIAVLPGGYHAVVISGTRYYTVGGVYYRPQMYSGRTVYVRVHI